MNTLFVVSVILSNVAVAVIVIRVWKMMDGLAVTLTDLAAAVHEFVVAVDGQRTDME